MKKYSAAMCYLILQTTFHIYSMAFTDLPLDIIKKVVWSHLNYRNICAVACINLQMYEFFNKNSAICKAEWMTLTQKRNMFNYQYYASLQKGMHTDELLRKIDDPLFDHQYQHTSKQKEQSDSLLQCALENPNLNDHSYQTSINITTALINRGATIHKKESLINRLSSSLTKKYLAHQNNLNTPFFKPYHEYFFAITTALLNKKYEFTQTDVLLMEEICFKFVDARTLKHLIENKVISPNKSEDGLTLLDNCFIKLVVDQYRDCPLNEMIQALLTKGALHSKTFCKTKINGYVLPDFYQTFYGIHKQDAIQENHELVTNLHDLSGYSITTGQSAKIKSAQEIVHQGYPPDFFYKFS